MKRHLLAAVAVVATCAAAPAFAAGNLVQNGGFTSGLDGWTTFGDTSFTVLTGGDALFGPFGDTGGIFQDLATTAGKTYRISFDLMNDSGPGGKYFAADFGPTNLISAVDQPGYAYTTFTYLAKAGSPTSRLAFTFREDPGYYHLKGVSVTEAVPEPGVWAMMIAGFGLAGAALRRRRAVAA